MLYATVAAGRRRGAAPAADAAAGVAGVAAVAARSRSTRSTDGGEHWFLATDDPRVAETGSQRHPPDTRPLGRIGGGDLPTITVDPKNENVVYSCSTVFWRTEDGGLTWSAVRGAPGGDDYQKSWVNPDNPNIILLVSDQGGVVSANRGESWSNWYNQPTAAMYHVTADNAFPVPPVQRPAGFRLGVRGQPRHGWRNHVPRLASGGHRGVRRGRARSEESRSGLRRQGDGLQPRSRRRRPMSVRAAGAEDVAAAAAAPANEPPARTVRTQPLIWSPKDPNVLFYATAGVWKTTNGGHSWTRDQRRPDPPDVGRARECRQVRVDGDAVGRWASITALAPSPLDVNVLWAGTGDGLIQVTTDGGAKWTNVTPPQIKPWTRIFNMEAGHFDTKTAYAAANTLRLDDMNPHFWRTHDGGKTWTEINNGIAGGAVANSIREDPRKKGLLYAATDTQVWVSFDDGDHWHSLRLDMPAISVRDIEVKDDASCMCSDLVAGTHGRGFWILDDVTPLRQAAEAAAASNAYLFKPATGIRIRFGTNDPTPWPPELPAGENPPPGAIVDYYLPAAAGEVKLEFLNAQGKVIRTYSSSDPVRNPDPATDPVAYNKLCQQTPTAPDCASAALLAGAAAGAEDHRRHASLHLGHALRSDSAAAVAADAAAVAATARFRIAPTRRQFAVGGAGRVHGAADRERAEPDAADHRQDGSAREDHARSAADLHADHADGDTRATAAAAYKEARAMVEKLKARPQSAANDALIKQVEEIAPVQTAPADGGGRRRTRWWWRWRRIRRRRPSRRPRRPWPTSAAKWLAR